MTSQEKTYDRILTFGPFRLDLGERELTKNGKSVPLTPKLFDTLALLVERRGYVVEKTEMLEKLWPESFVEEGSLSQNIFHLRKILKNGSGEAEYIETIPKRGYRFSAVVECTNGVVPIAETRHLPIPIRSLAVLPFTVLGGSANDENCLGLGAADAVIIKLSSLGHLNVVPTRTILKYANRFDGVREIARDLGVDAVLHGTIQVSDGRIRVSLQLISLHDNRAVWSEKVDERLDDIFAAQDSIAEKVSKAITLELSEGELQRLRKHGTLSPEAYQPYSIALYLSNKRTKDALEKAIDYFTRAIDADPRFARAYAGLADAAFWLAHGDSRLDFRHSSFERSRANALKAIELDPSVAEGYAALGTVRIKHDHDLVGAEESFKRALSLNPDSSVALSRYTYFLAAAGRIDEALEKIKLAREVDPLSPDANTSLAFIYYLMGRHDKAIHYCDISLALEPVSAEATLLLGRCYEQKEMLAESEAAYLRVREMDRAGVEADELLAHLYAITGRKGLAKEILFDLTSPAKRDAVRPYNIAAIYSALDDHNKADEWLKKPFLNWTERLRMLRFDPRLAAFRADPSFNDLLTMTRTRVGQSAASHGHAVTAEYIN